MSKSKKAPIWIRQTGELTKILDSGGDITKLDQSERWWDYQVLIGDSYFELGEFRASLITPSASRGTPALWRARGTTVFPHVDQGGTSEDYGVWDLSKTVELNQFLRGKAVEFRKAISSGFGVPYHPAIVYPTSSD
jgi:hypothetical protein